MDKLLCLRLICWTLVIILSIFGSLIWYCYHIPWSQIPPDSYWSDDRVNTTGWKWKAVPTNGIRLNVAMHGNPSDPLIICLHGFPQTGLLAWHNQVHDLANAGYFVVVPDMRGYNTSAKPEGIGNYTLDVFAEDVLGLIQYSQKTKAIVIGHDWGGLIGWWVAHKHPDKVERLVVMSAPHFGAYRKSVSYEQLQKSWYMLFFQLPMFPEWKLKNDNFTALQSLFGQSGLPGKTFSRDSLRLHMQAWDEKGALKSILNYYRGLLIGAVARQQSLKQDPIIHVKTLIFWGKHDIALTPEMAPASLELCEEGSKLVVIDGSHWVQLDTPKQVNEEILTFLKQT